jgi:Putative zinc-finger
MLVEHGSDRMQKHRAKVMEISCQEVWREISNYLEDEISAGVRTRMEEHFKGCKRCTAILDGTRNVVQLVGNTAVFDSRAGFDISSRQGVVIDGGRPEDEKEFEDSFQ